MLVYETVDPVNIVYGKSWFWHEQLTFTAEWVTSANTVDEDFLGLSAAMACSVFTETLLRNLEQRSNFELSLATPSEDSRSTKLPKSSN